MLNPVWLAALLVLVVNDHYLKSANVLPEALTGKLSDFAGMIVAPVLLVAVLRLRSKAGRLAAIGAVGLVFSAINVWPAAAVAFSRLCALFHIPFHTVVDPTDLLGLSALPVAWWVMHNTPMRDGFARYVQPLLATCAAVACVATSGGGGPPRWSTSGFLVNASNSPQTVRISLYEGSIDCNALPQDPARLLSQDAFGQGVTFELDAHEILPLEYNALTQAAGWQSFGNAPPAQGACDVVLVRRDGLEDSIVWWQDHEVEFFSALPLNTQDEAYDNRKDDFRQGRVDLFINNTGDPRLKSMGAVHITTIPEHLEASDCGSVSFPVQWSSIQQVAGVWSLLDIEQVSTGCFDLTLGDVQGGGAGGMGAGGDMGTGGMGAGGDMGTGGMGAGGDMGTGGMGTGGMGAGGDMGTGGMGAGGSGGSEPIVPSEPTEHLFLCLPPEALPFEAGDQLSVFPHSASEGTAIRIYNDKQAEIILLTGQSDAGAVNVAGSLQPAECNGLRTDCGALVVPAVLSTQEFGELSPGDSVELPPACIRSRRLFLARAESVLAAPTACGDEDRDTIKMNADLVLRYDAEELQ